MKVDVFVEGRHASDGTGTAPVPPLRNANMSVEVSCYKKDEAVRIDDAKNPAFWMQVTLTRRQLEAMLESMDESVE
jgi:hypothetical protein